MNEEQTAPSTEVETEVDGAQPMKFMVTKWRMMCEKMKSAKPLSGEMPRKCILFCGFACNLKLTAGTWKEEAHG